MRISVVTIFPEMFDALKCCGVFRRALESGIIDFMVFNLRDFTDDRHHVVDDYPFGGGPGMVMKVEPFYNFMDWYKSKFSSNPFVILTTPQGKRFNSDVARQLAEKEELVFLCGRYEGVDERVVNMVDEELSIGDYVLSGGELAAMVMIEALSRFVPGVLGDEDSSRDSFYNELLDHSHYTRPREFRGMKVPDVLLKGDHEKIRLFRHMERIKRTILRRPDLFLKRDLNLEDKKAIIQLVRLLAEGKKVEEME
ncbi:MAG: tRNA (guanosine(37)-N1)-methyltransferase TrmD [Thermotogae bacterium]|nr:tRNA (guanosine(37)-N1)-methyltransferase TrmD [Thermotogota bacterium]